MNPKRCASGLARVLAAAAVMAAAACADVKPWQKGELAKPQMAFDPDPLESRYQQHIYFSKENASGGYGVGGGGCGCN
ncbi:MAG: DUF4266 domain-containing protein [Burkholderiaceae bacterium]|nr:DUF4266 domain-containing protein [Burkholderiaceae bacterium]